eukprot:1359184-Lingulodinium_polyedra.AAC.1
MLWVWCVCVCWFAPCVFARAGTVGRKTDTDADGHHAYAKQAIEQFAQPTPEKGRAAYNQDCASRT